MSGGYWFALVLGVIGLMWLVGRLTAGNRTQVRRRRRGYGWAAGSGWAGGSGWSGDGGDSGSGGSDGGGSGCGGGGGGCGGGGS